MSAVNFAQRILVLVSLVTFSNVQLYGSILHFENLYLPTLKVRVLWCSIYKCATFSELGLWCMFNGEFCSMDSHFSFLFNH